MIFTITAQGTDRPLELDILGYHLDVSCMDSGSISISDSDDRVSVRYIEIQPALATQAVSVDSSDTLQADLPVFVVPQQDDLPVIEAGQDSCSQTEVNADVFSLDAPELTEQLFAHLVFLRKQIATEANLPPYIIFHDSTLKDMCRLLPSSLEELRAVQGVGQAKLEKYGLRFIQAIQEFVAYIKGAS